MSLKDRPARIIEVAANIGIVVIALLFTGFAVRSYLKPSTTQMRPVPGTQLGLPDVDWGSHGNTVVLALSTNCHFCTESAPFYQALTKRCAAKGVPTIAVFPQSSQEASAYLQHEGVSVDEIRSVQLSGIRVSGTPTLLVVDGSGKIRAVWVGKLAPERQKEVFSQL